MRETEPLGITVLVAAIAMLKFTGAPTLVVLTSDVRARDVVQGLTVCVAAGEVPASVFVSPA